MKSEAPNAETTLPLSRSERIASLDVLRGVALLGILIMNIQAFAMPGAAYINPAAYGDLTGINQWVWIASHLFADQKFMALFSILFGAGICVFADRAEQTRGRSTALHYRRTSWLLVFGLLHAHLLWYGDILYTYALCGFAVYLLRNRSPRALLILGTISLFIPFAYSMLTGLSLEHFPADAVEGMMDSWRPDSATLAAEIDAYRGGWGDQQVFRSQTALFFESYLFATLFFWRASGMMLIGMALFRWQILSANRSNGLYIRLLVAGVSLGIILTVSGVWQNYRHGWSLEYSMFLGSQWNYWGSVSMALGYVGLVMLTFRKGWMSALQERLAAVGRTAFSNYIGQTLICITLFYGTGFGLFASLSRGEQVIVVFAIWIFQLIAAPLWLRKFRFGPLEWAWRSLTYWRLQPFRR